MIKVHIMAIPVEAQEFQALCKHCQDVKDFTVEVIRIYYGKGEPLVRFRARCQYCCGNTNFKADITRWNQFITENKDRSYED